MSLFFRACHSRWLNRVPDIKDVEHLRVQSKYGYDHIAVVVQNNGLCTVGVAVCGRHDRYSRRNGYNIAVGRALRGAATGWYKYDNDGNYPVKPAVQFTVDNELEYGELYREVKKNLEHLGILV